MQKLKQKIKDFLIWSQKYTQTDMIYVAKGGFWLILRHFILAGASFLLAVAFANLLDPVTFGNYRYVLSLVGMLMIFSLPGMETAIVQATARGLEGSFYQGFKVKFKWGLLGSLIALGLAGYYLIRGNYLLPIPLLISAIFLPLMQASQVYISFLNGKKLFNFQVKYTTLSQIISIAFLILVLFLTKNLFWLIATYFVSRTFLNYFFYLTTKRKFQPNKKESPQTLNYGKHLSLMRAISMISSQLDRVLLFTLIGAAPLAVYYFALAIPDQIRSILRNISTLALPKFSARPSSEIKASMKKRLGILLFFISVIIFGYVISAPYIYKIFFSQYLDSVFYSQIYIFSLLTLPTILIVTFFRAKIMQKKLYLLHIIPFLHIIFLVILIPLFGIMGALVALLAKKTTGTIFTLFLYHRTKD